MKLQHEADEMVEAAGGLQIPGELMQRLHDADQRLHAARQDLEKQMAASEYSHEKLVNRASEEVKAAEKAVEEINAEIHKTLKPGG